MLRNYFRRVFLSLRKNKLSMVAFFYLLFIGVLSILAPIFSPYDAYTGHPNLIFSPPLEGGHLFGTDELGRDLFTRVWEGARISLAIGVCAALLQAVIGVVYGGVAGTLGGLVDEIMMRVVDILYAIPYLVVVMLLILAMGRGEMAMILALAVTDWTGMARLMRGQALKLSQSEFVQASRALGAGNIRVLFKHIIPNSLGPIMVSMMFSIPAAMFAEAFLSFIGLGVNIPKASWGTLASDGYRVMTSYPWVMIIPVFFFSTAMLAFHAVGEAFKEAGDST